jgi:hypothetical protein
LRATRFRRGQNFIPTSCEKNLQPLYYPDCINLTEHCRCSVLCVTKCLGRNCSFRQGITEQRKSVGKWRQRMNELPCDVQEKIAGSYWNGKMPWKEE